MAKWDDLPTELKLQILRPYLILPASLTSSTSMHNHLQPNIVKLSLVSKEMRALAMDLYYKENTFEFSREESECWDSLLFRFPQPHITQMLRRVEVHIYFDTSFATLGELFKLQNSSTRMSWIPEDEPRDDDEEDDEYPEESRALREWVQSEECQRSIRHEEDQLNAHYYRVLGRKNKDDKLKLDLPTDILMLVQPRRAELLGEQVMISWSVIDAPREMKTRDESSLMMFGVVKCRW
jgi:hypothetical protein